MLTFHRFRPGLAAALLFLACSGAHAAFMAPEGTRFLYLSTGPEENGGGPTGTDLNASGFEEFDEARIELVYDAGPGGTLTLRYNVMTSEASIGGVDDLIIFSIDGVPVFRGGIDAPDAQGNFPLIGPFDGTPFFGPDGSLFADGQRGTQTFMIDVPQGPLNLSFMVLDELDESFDTALVVDDLRIDGVVLDDFEDDAPGSLPDAVTAVAGNVMVALETQFRTFLLPQPATLPMLAAAFAIVGLRRRV